jgi:hypothetical protein
MSILGGIVHGAESVVHGAEHLLSGAGHALFGSWLPRGVMPREPGLRPGAGDKMAPGRRANRDRGAVPAA